jgi:hypothetical protein
VYAFSCVVSDAGCSATFLSHSVGGYLRNFYAVTDRATLQIQELAALTGINNADIAKNRTKTNTGGGAPVAAGKYLGCVLVLFDRAPQVVSSAG